MDKEEILSKHNITSHLLILEEIGRDVDNYKILVDSANFVSSWIFLCTTLFNDFLHKNLFLTMTYPTKK